MREESPKLTTYSSPQIRQRRLAKLGGSSSSSAKKPEDESQPAPSALESPTAGASSAAATPDTPEVVQRKITISSAGSPKQPTPSGLGSGTQTPGGAAAAAAAAGSSSSMSKKRTAAEIASSPAATAATPVQPAARRPAQRDEPIEAFADKWLTEIFRISVDLSRTVDVHGHRLVYLPGVGAELAEAGEPLALSVGRLDEALLEAGSLVPANKPLLEYYLPCWKRVVRALKAIRNLTSEREEVLREAKRLCMSMCIFSLSMSELYK